MPITNIAASINDEEENRLHEEGFIQIPPDLNSGAAANIIHLWYETGDSAPITRIQLSFNDEMSNGLLTEGYQRVHPSLNTGGSGNDIYLWFCRGSTEYDVPIEKLCVSTEVEEEAQLFTSGWEPLACDLNRGNDGDITYLWLKRAQPTFVCDITATAGFDGDAKMFGDGYIRVDEDTNSGAGGSWVFIWYRQTTETQGAIRDLQVSFHDAQSQRFTEQGYTSVSQDLNEGARGAGGARVLLWFQRDGGGEPIRTVTVILNTAVESYKRAGANVTEPSLNAAGSLFLCVK
ncbi:uncharacterized protein PAE49_006390 [Odontesthes bonariensis]|uniref:uncharacterized protein LOC142382757 n=1 Tax=Odontesthes bonariensis TaxID=219752 RepID=UPI003F58F046